ncbi:hypothetical protein B0H10DRAFT_2030718 [Mycena sp. CBHHK59/15]|nr:hypothetical protein B0H10DRAFT_2030718 [Mycena sp. CBHHK59/15]
MAEYVKPPLDNSLYKLVDTNPDDLAFIKTQSGISDPEALKSHIIDVQTKAYDLYGHHCIRSFAFTRTKISTLPAYRHVLSLGRQRDGAILLDLGCCFGTDLRKIASDGFPVQNLLASDLRRTFWDLGHELFRSSPETFPVVFLAGDALDPTFLKPSAPLLSFDAVTAPPPLASLTTLTPLCGTVSAIHISSVFHLFFEPQQLELARALAGLLSPLPGSVIFGSHVGRHIKGFREESLCSGGQHMFCHSPESWQEMWEEVFPGGTIKVDVALKMRASDMDISDRDKSTNAGLLIWSVMRV